jgi:uncharacterized protein
MNQQETGYGMYEQLTPAAQASAADRSEFIRRTYGHLAGAVAIYVGLVSAILSTPNVESLVRTMTSGMNWLLVLGAFVLVSIVAQRMARSAVSLSTQYAGLGLYILAMSVISTPLIWLAASYGSPGTLPTAAFGTLGIFGALTAFVMLTRKDFSFLRTGLMVGVMVAMGLIVCFVIFGVDPGPLFAVAMIGLMAAWILYDTSNVLHHYSTNQYVVASLALFASLVVLFWYVLRLLMYLQSRE